MAHQPSTCCTRLSLVALAALGLALADDTPGAAEQLGEGAHRYEWRTDWPALPDGARLGSTHGGIAFDEAGRVYVNTDAKYAFVVFEADGTFVRGFGEEFANGVHGMTVANEDGRAVLYFAHTRLQEVVSMTLEGEVLWRSGVPVESGVYDEGAAYHPTSVALAPDGRLFVADGYGAGWIHVYDKDREYVRSFGGPGTEPGKFRTPHGILIDTRGETPTLLVADRENGRLQRFTLEGEHLEVLEAEFRRPCSIALRGDDLVVADLAGRVTLLGKDDRVLCHLGDNPDPAKRANFGVATDDWADGEFLAPHYATWDASGDLFVMDWNEFGRVTRLARLP